MSYASSGGQPHVSLHYPSVGLYLYASTEEILNRVLRLRLPFGKTDAGLTRAEGFENRRTDISPYGEFDDSKLFSSWRFRDGIRTAVGAGLEKRRKKRTPTWGNQVSGCRLWIHTEDMISCTRKDLRPEELEDALYGREFW